MGTWRSPGTMILLDQDLDPHPALPLTARPDLPVRQQIRLPSVRSLAQFLRVAQDAARLEGQVTVLLTTENAIRRLNRQFRGIDKATDVLSFPAAVAAFPGIAGDIAISVPTAQRQAMEQGHALTDEVKILILHGLLHLSGYDHEVDNGRMERRERLLRRRLGLPQGLIERSTNAPCPILAPALGRKGGKPQRPTRAPSSRSRRP